MARQPRVARFGRCLLSALCTAPVAQLGPQAVRAESADRASARSTVSRARSEARRLLVRPQCQQLFAEFKDATGRTLRERLEATRHTAASYLDIIEYVDGTHLPPCKDSDVFALTPTGGRVTFICRPQFGLVDSRNSTIAAAILIHEELHSLGLGENPPRSQEITLRVLSLCHR